MNMIDLDQRVAIVTGGAQGIGLAVAARLLASRARVCLFDIDEAALAGELERGTGVARDDGGGHENSPGSVLCCGVRR